MPAKSPSAALRREATACINTSAAKPPPSPALASHSTALCREATATPRLHLRARTQGSQRAFTHLRDTASTGLMSSPPSPGSDLQLTKVIGNLAFWHLSRSNSHSLSEVEMKEQQPAPSNSRPSTSPSTL